MGVHAASFYWWSIKWSKKDVTEDLNSDLGYMDQRSVAMGFSIWVMFLYLVVCVFMLWFHIQIPILMAQNQVL